MKHPYLLSMLAMAVGTALTGCGGGGGGDNDEPAVSTLQVTVIDGYLRNALVWLDVNGNNQQDSDEPSARSGEGGKAVLDVKNI